MMITLVAPNVPVNKTVFSGGGVKKRPFSRRSTVSTTFPLDLRFERQLHRHLQRTCSLIIADQSPSTLDQSVDDGLDGGRPS